MTTLTIIGTSLALGAFLFIFAHHLDKKNDPDDARMACWLISIVLWILSFIFMWLAVKDCQKPIENDKVVEVILIGDNKTILKSDDNGLIEISGRDFDIAEGDDLLLYKGDTYLKIK